MGTTVRIRREPAIDPEKCAGGAGSIEIGPTSMRYVPSTSNVPSARPCPHPTARLHSVSVTERQALSPLHRPVASGPFPGPIGPRSQASRQVPAMSAATSTCAGRRLMRPRFRVKSPLKVSSRSVKQAPGCHRPPLGLTSGNRKRLRLAERVALVGFLCSRVLFATDVAPADPPAASSAMPRPLHRRGARVFLSGSRVMFATPMPSVWRTGWSTPLEN